MEEYDLNKKREECIAILEKRKKTQAELDARFDSLRRRTESIRSISKNLHMEELKKLEVEFGEFEEIAAVLVNAQQSMIAGNLSDVSVKVGTARHLLNEIEAQYEEEPLKDKKRKSQIDKLDRHLRKIERDINGLASDVKEKSKK